MKPLPDLQSSFRVYSSSYLFEDKTETLSYYIVLFFHLIISRNSGSNQTGALVFDFLISNVVGQLTPFLPQVVASVIV